MHDSTDSINDEIQLVSKHITDAAKHTLPCIKPRKQRFFKDSTLKQICDKSKGAWKAWVDAGRQPDGPLYDSKNDWRREVKKRVKEEERIYSDLGQEIVPVPPTRGSPVVRN